jgi:hypothetical protein
MNEPRNFGDIVGDVLTARKEADRAKREAEHAAMTARRKELGEKLRPLITAMEQTKERYPKTYIFDTGENIHTPPHFYVTGSKSVSLHYDPESEMCMVKQDGKEPLKSKNVEDLIPPFLDLLATAVAHGLNK